MGSIFKRGKHWQIRYYLPVEADGSRRQHQETCRGMTKREAEDLLARRLQEIRTGNYVETTELGFGAYLDQWLDRAAGALADTTLKAYRIYARLYIVPALGAIRLQALSPLSIQTFYDALLRAKLSAKTVRNIHGIIHVALQQGVKFRMIYHNPADAVELPRHVRPDIRTASADDIHRLLDAAIGTDYYVPVYIAAATGMRRGEIVGLQWPDFDPARSTLAVRRSLVQVPGKLYTKEPKTGKARVVPIPATLRDLLTARRAAAGESLFICCRANGSVITPSGLGEGMEAIRRRAGVDVTLHGLRHSQATMLISAGVPVKVVSERLGHATVQMTQETYAHVLPHMQDRAVEVIEAMLDRTSA